MEENVDRPKICPHRKKLFFSNDFLITRIEKLIIRNNGRSVKGVRTPTIIKESHFSFQNRVEMKSSRLLIVTAIVIFPAAYCDLVWMLYSL